MCSVVNEPLKNFCLCTNSVWEIVHVTNQTVITGHRISLYLWLVELHMKNRLLFISWIKTTLVFELFWVEQTFTIQTVFLKMFNKRCKVSQDVTFAGGIRELQAAHPRYNVCMETSQLYGMKYDQLLGKYQKVIVHSSPIIGSVSVNGRFLVKLLTPWGLWF